jgi:hypothetical protein
MTEKERNEIIARAISIPAEELARKIAVDSASVLGKLIVNHNKKKLEEQKRERQVRRLGLWG